MKQEEKYKKDSQYVDVPPAKFWSPCSQTSIQLSLPDRLTQKCSLFSSLLADCGIGKFSIAYAAISESTCATCPKGSYTDTEGTVSCLSCPAGRFNTDDATSPSLHDSLSTCSICTAGKINDDPATDPALHYSCQACPPGKKNDKDDTSYSDHDEAGDCQSCSPGRYSNDDDGATMCLNCPLGKSSGVGAFVCTGCPSGYECSGK